MPTDQQVTSRMILESVLQLQRRGSTTAALEHLEQVEPDLASYLMESLSAIYHELLSAGAAARRSRRIYRQVELMALVSIVALRKGHYELWRQTQAPGESDGSTTPPSDP